MSTVGFVEAYDQSMLYELVCAGMLHDIGKAEIGNSILNKAGKLDDKEMERIKAHPIRSLAMLAKLNVFVREVLLGVLSHHERMDGTGYPQGLKGDQISLFARIIAVADVYDAMTSTRTYNAKRSPFK